MAWLNRERISVYPRIFLVLYILIYGVMVFAGKGMLDVNGKPIGSDFLGYWAASTIVRSGDAVGVYDLVKLFALEKRICGVDYFLPINYPPTFLLLIWPLSLAPYIPSLVLWLFLTFLLFFYVVKTIAPSPATGWLVAAFPATFQNIIHGQNGFLSAAILGGGLLLLEKRPFWSGMILGMLTYKPHLAILIPVALAAGRYWKALAGMCLSTALFISISILAFGMDPWTVFFQKIFFAFRILEQSALPLFQMISTLTALRLAGCDLQTARMLHGIVAAGALSALVWVWFKRSSFHIRASVLILAVLLFTPHANTYDLVLLSLPMAWVGWEIYRGAGTTPGGKVLLPFCWVSPLICVPVALVCKVQMIPLVLIGFLVFVLRMDHQGSLSAAPVIPQR